MNAAVVRLHPEAGASEAWLVDVRGATHVPGPDDARETSAFDADVSAVASPGVGEGA